jgi:hypothetical protein
MTVDVCQRAEAVVLQLVDPIGMVERVSDANRRNRSRLQVHPPAYRYRLNRSNFTRSCRNPAPSHPISSSYPVRRVHLAVPLGGPDAILLRLATRLLLSSTAFPTPASAAIAVNFVAVLIFSLLSSSAAADPVRVPVLLLHTGTGGQLGGGQALFLPESPERQFNIGVKFKIDIPLVLTQGGANFFSGSDAFVALVALTGPEDFPDSLNLSTGDVLATNRIVVPGPPGFGSIKADASAALNVDIGPGWYALVFGTHLFGAGQVASALTQYTASPGRYTLFLGERNNGSYQNFDPFFGLRIFANGLVAPTPEPGTLALCGTGLVGLAARLRRRQRERNHSDFFIPEAPSRVPTLAGSVPCPGAPRRQA